jgi:hypothetical protein
MSKSKFFSNKSGFYLLSLASLLVLSGCWFKSKKNSSAIDPNDTSMVLLTVNGVPEITVNSLEADINELSEMDQQIKMMMLFNPDEMRLRILQEDKKMVVVKKWADESGVRNSADYQQKRNKILKHVDMQLDFEQFLNQHKVEVSDQDVQKYYDENKQQDPRILLSPAGIKSQAIEFSEKPAANNFYNKLKHAGADHLDKLAKDHKLFIRNLGNVNDQSYADIAIKDALNKVSKFPSVILVENQDKTKFWVVVASSQEEAKYQELEAIKENLKQILASKAIGDMLETKIPEYAKQFNIVEDLTYFDQLKNSKKDADQADLQPDDLLEQIDIQA